MIIVTGGAGFIGSNLLAALEEKGRSDLIVCDVLGDDQKWRNIAKREIADIVPPEDLFDYLEGRGDKTEAIFHMGAHSVTTETDADLMVELNFRYTMDVWDWCAANRVPLIYASSAATYGDGGNGFDDDASPDALKRLRPLNLYAWSKHLADRRIARLVAEGAPRPPHWAGLKFFNVYGPNEGHKGGMRSMAAQIFDQILEIGHCRLFKSDRDDILDGGQQRDFVWVGDCVDVMLWLLDREKVNGLFNCGSGQAHTFTELAGAVFDALERDVNIDFVDMPPGLRGRYQHFTEARLDRLREAGYESPMTSLVDGVRTYVREYLSQTDPYR